MKYFVPLLLLCACGPTSNPVLMGYRQSHYIPENWSQQDVDDAAEYARWFMQKQFPPGSKVWLTDFEQTPVDPFGRLDSKGNPLKIAGYTQCFVSEMVVWNWNSDLIPSYQSCPRKGSIIHEMMHLLQGCDAHPIEGDTDIDHANWVRMGISAAVDNYKRME